MADGRWQQGTPASFSKGLGGFVDLVGRGAVERRGGKGTMKTIIAQESHRIASHPTALPSYVAYPYPAHVPYSLTV